MLLKERVVVVVVVVVAVIIIVVVVVVTVPSQLGRPKSPVSRHCMCRFPFSRVCCFSLGVAVLSSYRFDPPG